MTGSLDLDLSDLALPEGSRSKVFHGETWVTLSKEAVGSLGEVAFPEQGWDPQPSGHLVSGQISLRRCHSALPTPPGPVKRDGRLEPTGPNEWVRLHLSGWTATSGIGRIDEW